MIQLTPQDKRELEVACEVFSVAVVRDTLNKNAGIKEAAVEKLWRMVVTYEPGQSPDKPGKMLRATTQVLVRLLRDKVRTE